MIRTKYKKHSKKTYVRGNSSLKIKINHNSNNNNKNIKNKESKPLQRSI